MLSCLASNTSSFDNADECVAVVEGSLNRAGWQPDYSRRLVVGSLRFSDGIISFGELVGHFLYLDIHNNRSDIAALETTGRLSGYAKKGGDLSPSEIRSPLKATGRPGYAHTIFPRSHEAFDLLCVGRLHEQGNLLSLSVPPVSGTVTSAFEGAYFALLPRSVFLNTALDVRPQPSLPITNGVWTLQFEFFAIGFPLLTVCVDLSLKNDSRPTAQTICC
jgi:hypothetical protein